MAQQRSLTAANSIYMLAVQGLFPTPQRLQGYAADSAFDTDAVDNAEVTKGVDGRMSAGWVPTMVAQTITIQADSESAFLFETWFETEKANREKLWADGEIILISIGRKYRLSRGILTRISPIPATRRILQPRPFTITWDEVTPMPIGS